MKLAEREHGLLTNLEVVDLPTTKQADIKTIKDNDFARLEQHLLYCSDNSNVGLLLCAYSGLRLGEACALRWEDIDWQMGTMHISKAVARLSSNNGTAKTELAIIDPKTDTSKRHVPIPSIVLNALGQLYKGQAPEAYVLTGTKRFMNPRTYQYRFKRVLQQLNIDATNFHALRHTFASNSIRHGVDAKSLSEILGHSSVQMTLDRYVHSSLESKCKQMRDLHFGAVS